MLGDPGGRCEVRLLGSRDQTDYVWAECSAKDGAAASMPVRVGPNGIELPEDGSGYGDSIRQLFPRALADDILEHQEGLRP